MSIEITEVQIIPVTPTNDMIALANIIIDGCFCLKSIGIHKKRDREGYRITYPTKKLLHKDLILYHPIKKETSLMIEEKIFEQLDKEIENGTIKL